MRFFISYKLINCCIIFVALFLTETHTAKILSLFAYPGPSQYIMASALLKGLAERGHQVTSISTFPQKKPLKNFRDIPILENSKLFDRKYYKLKKKK